MLIGPADSAPGTGAVDDQRRCPAVHGEYRLVPGAVQGIKEV